MIAAAFVRNFSQSTFDFDAMDSAGGGLSGNSHELYCHTNVDFISRDLAFGLGLGLVLH